MPADGAPAVFYDRVVSDRRGLPYSEGVVVKDNHDPTGAAWFKVKTSDLEDFELVQVLPGKRGKFATSAGAVEVRDPATGTTSKVGSFKVNDQTRQYIYDHREELKGATVRIEVMEKNPSGTQRAGRFVDFHPDKNQSNEAIAAMQMAWPETVEQGHLDCF